MINHIWHDSLIRKLIYGLLLSCCFSSISIAQTTKPLAIKAVSEHWPPFQIVKNQQVVEGLSFEIVQAALKEANLTAKLNGTSWARAFKMAQEEPNVLIFSIARTKKREKMFKWVGDILTVDNSLWHLAKRKDINILSLQDAKNYRLAVPRSDVRHQFLLDNGFRAPQHLDVVTNYEYTLKMLYRNRTDLVMANKLVLAHIVNEMKLDPTLIREVPGVYMYLGTLYIAFSLDTDDALVERLSQGLNKVKQNGVYDQIVDKWYKRLGKLGADDAHAPLHKVPTNRDDGKHHHHHTTN